MDNVKYCPQSSAMEQLRAFSRVFFAGMLTMAVIFVAAGVDKR